MTEAAMTEAWRHLLAAPRTAVAELTRSDLPDSPGVYLWHHDGEPVYVGTATSLRRRAWGTHLGAGVSLAGSSLRRSVCELLYGIPTTVTGRPLRQKVTPDQAAGVRAWLGECELGWTECATPADAAALEAELRRAWMPPLNRI